MINEVVPKSVDCVLEYKFKWLLEDRGNLIHINLQLEDDLVWLVVILQKKIVKVLFRIFKTINQKHDVHKLEP